MSTIKTYLRVHSKTQKSGIIWVSFYIGREKINFSTKISCEKSSWSEKKTVVLEKDPNSADKNLIIEQIHARINSVFVKYRLRNRKLTKDGFLRSYNRPDDFENFYDFVESYRKGGSDKMIELSTKKVHDTVIRKIKEQYPYLHFDDIDNRFLDHLYSFLRKDLGNNENTAYKNMATFKKYVRAAWKAGYIDVNPFDEWSIKRCTGKYVFLTEDEMIIFLKAYRKGFFEKKYHEALGLFLFMCFSSVHIGDARKLALEQFTQSNFTYYRIKNRNRKPVPIIVPVSDALNGLLRDIVGTRKHGLIFDHLPADQTLNHYLKHIAHALNVKKEVTLKSGRHTFATFFLRKTKDLAALKELLGHTSMNETMIYAHVMDDAKVEGIRFFNSL